MRRWARRSSAQSTAACAPGHRAAAARLEKLLGEPHRAQRQTHGLLDALVLGERAELSFDLFLQARNKVVSAYQEIMRLQM